MVATLRISLSSGLKKQIYSHILSVGTSMFYYYSGNGPAAYFWADEKASPTDDGIILFDSEPVGDCGKNELGEADGSITYRVEFPAGMTINDYLGGCKYYVFRRAWHSSSGKPFLTCHGVC
jgi:hypothetical protein